VAETLRFDVLGRGDASDLERLANAVDRFADRLKALDRVRANPKVDVDTDQAERQVGKFAEDMQRRLRRAIESLPDIELDADASDADRELADIRRQLAELDSKRIGVDVDTEGARQEVLALERRLAQLSDRKLNVGLKADVEAALAELRRASGEADRLDGKRVRIKVDVDRGLSEAIVQIAALGRALGALTIPVALVAATPLIVQLGAAAVSASGAVGVLPGILLGLGAAGATAAVGLSGVGEALKNLDDAKKLGEALAKLAPNAREFVRAVQEIGPAWRDIKLETQNQLFAGLGAEMRKLSAAYVPALRTGLTGVATALNATAKDFVGFATSTRTVENVSKVFDNTRKALDAMRPVAQNVVAAFLDMGVVGSDIMPRLASSLTNATGRFRTFIDQARRSGELAAWIEQGIASLNQLGRIAGNVGSTLLNVFRSQEEAGANLLTKLEEITGAMERWTASAQGQETLANVFRTISETISALMPGLQALGEAIQNVINRLADVGVFQSAASALSAIAIAAAPVVETLGNIASVVLPPLLAVVQALAPALVPLAAAFLGLRVAATVAAQITTLSNALRTFVGDLRGAEGGVDRLGGKLRTAEGGFSKFRVLLNGLGTALGTGGALGLGIAAAVTAVGLLVGAWADAEAKAAAQKSAIDGLAASLNSYSGAATEATLAQRAQEIGTGKLADGTTSYATALARAGVSTKDFAQATTGNEQALQKVRTQLDAATAVAIQSSPVWANNADQIRNMGISVQDLAAAAQGNGPALDRLREAAVRAGAGSVEATSSNNMLIDSLMRAGGSSAEMGQRLNEMAAQYGAAAQQARDAGAANMVFADVLDVVKQGFAGMAQGIVPTQKMVQGLKDLNQAALDTASSAGQAAAEYGGVAGGAAAAAKSMEGSRASFIEAATAAGMTAEQAGAVADQIGLIPSAAAIIFQTNATGVQAEMITLNERIKALPPNTDLVVTAPTAEAVANLESLGFKVEAIPGTKDVRVSLEDGNARARLDAFVALANGTTVTMTGDMDTSNADGKIRQTVQLGNGQTAIMTYDADASAADGKIHATVDLGNGQHATLTYDANPDPATGQIKATVQYADGTTGTVTLNPNDMVTPTIDQLRAPVDTPVNLTPNTSAVPPAKTEAGAPVDAPVNLTPFPGMVPQAKAEAGTPVQTPIELVPNNAAVGPAKTEAATPTDAPVNLTPNTSAVPPAKTEAAAPTDAPVNLTPNTSAVPGAKAEAATPTDAPVNLTPNASAVPGAKADAASPVTTPVTFTVDDSAVATAKSNAASPTSSVHTITVTDNVPAAKQAASQPSESLHTLNCDDKAVVDAKSRAEQPTESMHTINCNDSAVTEAKRRAQTNTSSTHTITVRTVHVGGPVPRAAGAYAVPRAAGAYTEPARMARGGMRTMSAARAEIVPARQPRIIGDRMHGPEAFIPVNRSARSMAILNRTAMAMGQQLVPAGTTPVSVVAPAARPVTGGGDMSGVARAIAALAAELRTRGGVTINNEFAVPAAERVADEVARAHRITAALGLFG